MSNIFLGVLTITISLIGFYYSWRYWKSDNYRIALLLLVVCGFLLRLYTSADFFLHEWDERYHALVAKNLIKHPLKPTLYDNPVLPYNYKSWAGNHVWLHKQPLPLWTMALSMWLFGVNEISLRLPSIIFTTIGIWLTYAIAKYFFNRKVGYIAALLFAINGLIIELTAGRVATDHIDIFFLFFVELAIFFSIRYVEKRKLILNILVGFSTGAAILSKWLPALIVLPIWILIVYDTGIKFKFISLHFLVILISCILVFLPWQLYIFSIFPMEAKWEAGYNVKHITEVLSDQTGTVLYFLDKIRINYGELIYLPVVWFTYKTFQKGIDLKRSAVFIWFAVPVFFFSLIKTKMQAYILFTSPALFIMTAEFYFALQEYKKTHRSKWIVTILMILFIALPARYSMERIKPFQQSARKSDWVQELKTLNNRNITKGVLFNYSKPIEAMFYTDLTVYSTLPEQEVIEDLIEKNYTVIINDDGRISEDIREIEGAIFEQINAYDLLIN